MEVATALRTLPAQRRVRSFERDCERLRPLGEAFVLRRFGGSLNRADAEDAVSEVLIRLHRRVAEGRPPKNLRAAFFTSVRNAAIDQLRSRAAKPTVALEAAADAAADAASPVERAESREDAVRLQEALQRMRGNYREAIVLRFGLGMTVPEISRHLQISLPAAKKLVLRATQQVKKRLESIEGAEFCPEMRDAARRSLFEKEASGLANDGEAEILRRHFEHCGSCKSFLASLHDTLHEFGSTTLLAAVAGDHLGKVGIVDHLTHWAGKAVQGAEAGNERLRMVAYKASGAFHTADGGAASALTTTSQKIIAICGAGAATTATCLATGVVGPGVGATAPSAPAKERPAKVRTYSEMEPTPVEAPVVESAPSSEEVTPPEQSSSTAGEASSKQESNQASNPSASPPSSAPSPPPAEEASSPSEFGIEGGGSSSSSAPAPAPAPEPVAPSSVSPVAPSTVSPSSSSSSSTSGSSGGGSSSGGSSSGGSGGGEFGF